MGVTMVDPEPSVKQKGGEKRMGSVHLLERLPFRHGSQDFIDPAWMILFVLLS